MRPSLPLPRGTTVLEVADATRAALDEFLELDPNDKLALSEWLIGPYRQATSYGPRRLRPSLPPSGEHVSVVPLSMIVSHAQVIARAALEAAEQPGADGLLPLMPAVVDVIPIHDAFGGHGFAAVDLAHAKLDARALSLLLADYLTRPDEYVASVDQPAPRRHSTGKLRALSG
jgi:hypothetical protein